MNAWRLVPDPAVARSRRFLPAPSTAMPCVLASRVWLPEWTQGAAGPVRPASLQPHLLARPTKAWMGLPAEFASSVRQESLNRRGCLEPNLQMKPIRTPNHQAQRLASGSQAHLGRVVHARSCQRSLPNPDAPLQRLPARFPPAAPTSPGYSWAATLQRLQNAPQRRPRLRFPRAYRYRYPYRYRSICLLIV